MKPHRRARPCNSKSNKQREPLAMPSRQIACSAYALVALAMAGTAAAQPAELPALLVYLGDIEPTIHQDIRYATPDNFTGRPVPGYAAAECILLSSVARALVRVQRDLKVRGLSLKVYDCYRPRRAVAAFLAWAQTGHSDPFSPRYHPRIERGRLHGLGYVAAVSGHSYGNSIDATLVELSPTPSQSRAGPRSEGPCHLAPRDSGLEPGIDMGTGFDCFDANSHIQAAGLTPAQRDARRMLHDVMNRQGFRGYTREWWHFSLDTDEGGGRSFDIPITARRP